MKIINIFMVSAIILLAGGCATTVSDSNLYWGKYSRTLYQLKKNPGQKTATAHKDELIAIIKKSREMGLTPPPGVQAELGYILFNEGKKKPASTLIRQEAKSYPESKILMEKIHKMIKEKGGRK